ncbi:MAG: 1,4-alpha-glucan branching protein GlgB [Eubacteriales bacterium]|nr:1,4-alpha-glucan branching protein GlgB [Eubacteriales bacterium]
MSFAITQAERKKFSSGTSCSAYKFMGAHLRRENGVSGVHFALWAPNAKSCSVLCERTDWTGDKGAMQKGEGGIWESFVPHMRAGELYRFLVEGCDGEKRWKADPYAFYSELRPSNCSIVCSLGGYEWGDGAWEGHSGESSLQKPMAIYEVHLGSWKKDFSLNSDGFLDYRTLADQLAEYVTYMGYTHVELIGICEHPFDGSWGYQVTGFYAPTSRYGRPDDFRYFVDKMHRCGIGVILDWVPAHFPKDSFGLRCFDGSALYESPDPLLAEYPEWGTMAFNHARNEVRSFLISGAIYWIREFHIDALRVDAVASMLHTGFGRPEGRLNRYGGTENLDSIAFLRQLNRKVRMEGAFIIAEDSSIMPGITEDVKNGGIGFNYKWNMGWMNDTLKYIGTDSIYRHWDHTELTHSPDYAFFENYVLVLSHDEVVHLKKPMLLKAPAGRPEQFANLKALYTYQFTHPGKKLLFMGQDFGDDKEWDEKRQISWELASLEDHRAVLECVRKLLHIYRTRACLYADSKNPATFEWINSTDSDRNIISFIRRNPWNYEKAVLVVCSFSPMQYDGYCVGAPVEGYYKRIFSTYDTLSGAQSDIPPLTAQKGECDGRDFTLKYDLRPFECMILDFPEK